MPFFVGQWAQWQRKGESQATEWTWGQTDTMLQAGKERMIYMKTSLYFFSKTTLKNSIRIIITIIQEMWVDLPAIKLIYFFLVIWRQWLLFNGRNLHVHTTRTGFNSWVPANCLSMLKTSWFGRRNKCVDFHSWGLYLRFQESWLNGWEFVLHKIVRNLAQ